MEKLRLQIGHSEPILSRLAFLQLPALLALFMLLASCGSLVPENGVPSSGPGGNGAAEESQQRVVLEFWHTYSDIETEVFESKVLPLFEQAHPGIAIHAVRKDHTNQLRDSVLATAADNKAPDIMRMDIVWVPFFAKQGLLTEISALEGFTEIRNGFIGSLIETNEFQGRYYGLPVNANTRAAIFNRTLLREAGLEEPPATFAQLADAARRLKQADPNRFGIGICCSNGWGTLPYFWTFGGELTNDTYTAATGYLDSSDSMAALTKLKDWYDEGIISSSIIGGEPGTWDGILKGQLLMIDDAHWFYTVNAEGENKELLDNIVIGLIPDDVEQGTSVIGGENLVIFEQTKHQAEAWTFVRWMMSERPQQLIAETGLIPTIRELQHANGNDLFAPYLRQLDRARPRPPVPQWTAVEDQFARMVERILTGEQSVDEAAKETAARIDKLLK